jgi:hypothetical protein
MLSDKVSRPDENSSVLDGILDGKGRMSDGAYSGEFDQRFRFKLTTDSIPN